MPHISLVFREMWDTTAADLQPVPFKNSLMQQAAFALPESAFARETDILTRNLAFLTSNG